MASPDADGHGGSVIVLHESVGRYRQQHHRSHTEHGLTYLVEGRVRLEHGGPVTAEAGTFSVMPAGVPHRVLDGRDMEYWLLGFCATCLSLDESQPLMRPFRRVRSGATPVVPVARARRSRVVRLYRELREEQERGAEETPELVRSLVLLLLGEVSRAMPGETTPAPVGSLVADALAFIQQRCLSPISLRDVAAAVHRTPAHVASTVKKETGHSVGEWIASGRIAEAAARLVHTDDSLDAIAEHVGWADKTHFIRQFRKARGITPAAFRRATRERHRGER